jgi:hypothetical protein
MHNARHKYLVVVASVVLLMITGPARAWDAGLLSAPLVIDGRTVPYREFAVYLLPGQHFEVRYVDASERGKLEFLRDTQGPVGSTPLRAPATPGLNRMQVVNTVSGEHALINVFTMAPASAVASQHLNGYRIGTYPREPLRGQDIYRPPKGFVEVTEANAGTRLSPNFTLAQFLCKQESEYPKYVVLRTSLLLKLENILATLNQRGHATDGLVIMSGYRTPWYNQVIGNVRYSRHVWGGATDFYVDEQPRDGRMDDLNGDGKTDRGDARWLAEFIKDMSARGEFGSRVGGIGVYGATAAHGPFVHVDARGTRARW